MSFSTLAKRAAAVGALGIIGAAISSGVAPTAGLAQSATTAAPGVGAVATAAPATAARTLRNAPDVYVVIDNNVRLTDRLAAAKSAVRTYVNNLPEGSRVGLVTFGESPQMPRDLSDPAALSSALGAIIPEGDRAITGQLYGAVIMAADNLRTSDSKYPTVLLLSDGRDDGASNTFSEATRALAASKARVQVVDLGADGAGLAVLRQFTSASGQLVLFSELEAIGNLASTVTEPPTQLALQSVPDAGLRSGGTSPIMLVLGGLAVVAAIGVGSVAVLGPRQKRVDLVEALRPASQRGQKRKKEKQATVITGLAERLSDAADKQLAKSGKDRGLNAKLEQAALNLRSGEFIILAVCIGLAVAAVANLMWGRITAVIGLIVGIVGFVQWVSIRAKKRSKRFGEQLPDTLQLLASSLRAGQGLVQAVDSVAREAESPTKEEFHRMVVETRLGRDLVDSMRSTAVRINSEDMEWVVPAVEINREVGGDLAEVLDQVGQTIRDRADLRRQVKTLSAEGRLSAIILLALPIVLAGFIKTANPTYMDPLFSGVGLWMIGAAGLAMTIGGFWLMKICKIEF
jgi:tight adherence protein B